MHCIVCIVCSAQYALTIRMAPHVHHFSNLEHLAALGGDIFMTGSAKDAKQSNFEHKALEV